MHIYIPKCSFTQYIIFSPAQEVMCKLLGATQNCCVFFSSFSILLIAVDRYIFIVHPTTGQISTRMVRMSASRDRLIFLVHMLGQNGENGYKKEQNILLRPGARTKRLEFLVVWTGKQSWPIRLLARIEPGQRDCLLILRDRSSISRSGPSQ